jgi:glycosyltransferase involved in cell wall biosynthesis
MKIGICLRSWNEGGGIGVYTRSLVQAMLLLNAPHQYVLLYDNKAQLGQFRRYPNVKEIYAPAPTKLFWDQIAVPYFASREKVDVLFHSKFSIPLVSPCKTVTVIHGSERFVYPEFSKKSDMLFFKTIYPLYLRRATALIAVSENARRDIIQFLRIDPQKISTVYYGCAEYFRKINDNVVLEAIRKKYRLPARFLLNVGLIYPGKNIPNLLKALNRVRKQVDIKLVLAGTGRRMYQKDLNAIRELGLENNVVFPGYISHEDLVAVYNLAEAVVFPSFYESFGLVNVEANACGCPLVTSRTGGTPEAAGEAAVYVNPVDDLSIAEGILKVLMDSNLRKDLIDRGLRNVKRFTWEKTARQTLDILESVGCVEKRRTLRHPQAVTS